MFVRNNRFDAKILLVSVCTILSLLWRTNAFPQSSQVEVPITVVENGDKFLEHKQRRHGILQQICDRFIFNFWRGLPFPFPHLRQLAVRKGENTKRQEDNNEFQHISLGFTLNECVRAACVYLGFGTFLYSQVVEKWHWIDALYFSIVTVTTVGYGDLCPTSQLSKLVTILYGLSGIVALGSAIGSLGNAVVKAEVSALHHAERVGRKRMLKVFTCIPTSKRTLRQDRLQLRKNPTESTSSTRSYWVKLTYGNETNLMAQTQKAAVWFDRLKKNLVIQVGQRVLPSLTLLVACGLGMGHCEGWNWQDSAYYSLITAGTLGFGDFSPRTQTGRLLACTFLPVSVATAGEVLSGVAFIWINRRRAEAYKEIVKRKLSTKYLKEMDLNHDGKVSKEEFLEYMLVEMQMTEKGQVMELFDYFEKLDVTHSGYLDQNDLELMIEMQNNATKTEEIELMHQNITVFP